jgi:hypothetical protein
MDQSEAQILFKRFAAPLAAYASTSPERKELAAMLARNLWMAMIAGPEGEAEIWTVLKTIGGIDGGSLLVIQELYLNQMRPTVTAEQLDALRNLFPLKKQ